MSVMDKIYLKFSTYFITKLASCTSIKIYLNKKKPLIGVLNVCFKKLASAKLTAFSCMIFTYSVNHQPTSSSSRLSAI